MQDVGQRHAADKHYNRQKAGRKRAKYAELGAQREQTVGNKPTCLPTMMLMLKTKTSGNQRSEILPQSPSQPVWRTQARFFNTQTSGLW